LQGSERKRRWEWATIQARLFHYPLYAINLVELIFWLLLARGIQYLLNLDFSRSILFVGYTYGLGLMLWMLFIVFLQVSLRGVYIQFLRNCGVILYFPVDFIYGYLYSIPSELWVRYFLYYALLVVGNSLGFVFMFKTG
jgi:hypothetical protein